MVVFALLSWCYLVGAAPFVTTWITSQDNEEIRLAQINIESDVTIDWGDSTTPTVIVSTVYFANPSHIYATAGSYVVSITGKYNWTRSGNPTKANLASIVSWGDGLFIDSFGRGFRDYSNLRVLAPSNTQPGFLPGASLFQMFQSTSFNSPLDWDLTNVTSVEFMLANTSINQPINFRNTRDVKSIAGLFYRASQFNQPFYFDATSVTNADGLFSFASAFNQPVTLTNSNNLRIASMMFYGASSFNQPITFDLGESVFAMDRMFALATSFNQPINFPNTSQLIDTSFMFLNATSFNQPVTLNTSLVNNTAKMFSGASSFASTVNFTSTANVVLMNNTFMGVVGFDQDLSSWDVSQVVNCANFCPQCGLPSFSSCVPCSPIFTNDQTNVSMCNSLAPTTTAPSMTPSTSPSTSPSVAPSTAAPSVAPSTVAPSSPSGSAVSAAHAVRGETMLAATVAFFAVF